MPTPDKEKLRAELEHTGEQEVREKLAQGVYGSWKVPYIEHWLREKESSRAANAVHEARTTQRETLSWTRTGVIATIVGVIVAIVTLWLAL